MTIKITQKILSIPPYLSTSWSQVIALHGKEGFLAVTLVTGDTVQLEGLSPEILQAIFFYHAIYLEQESAPLIHSHEEMHAEEPAKTEEPVSFQMAFGNSLDGLGSMMQHNPDQMNAPSLPPEVLEKVSAISKIIAPSDEAILPQPVQGCNCFYCQLARVISPSLQVVKDEEEEKEEILDEELQFQQWSINQTGDHLFNVTNRLDDHESYRVFLGEPVGCTCGKQGCEHILAVLKS
jgi:hypothetical protein